MSRMRTHVATMRFKQAPIVESKIEHGLALACEFSHLVDEVVFQPFTAHMQFDGKDTRYSPDAVIHTSHGIYVVECKSFRHCCLQKWRDFFADARQFFKQYDLRYVVVDENDVASKALMDNFSQLSRLRLASELDAKMENLMSIVDHEKSVSMRQLEEMKFSGHDVLRALATRRVFSNIHIAFSPDSEIRNTPFRDHRDLLSKLGNAPKAELETVATLQEVYA